MLQSFVASDLAFGRDEPLLVCDTTRGFVSQTGRDMPLPTCDTTPRFGVANQDGHIPAQRRDLMPRSCGAFAASQRVITFL